MHATCSKQRFGGDESTFTFAEMAVFRAIEYSVIGLSFPAKNVFMACSANEIASKVNITRERLLDFGLRIDSWPETPTISIVNG